MLALNGSYIIYNAGYKATGDRLADGSSIAAYRRKKSEGETEIDSRAEHTPFLPKQFRSFRGHPSLSARARPLHPARDRTPDRDREDGPLLLSLFRRRAFRRALLRRDAARARRAALAIARPLHDRQGSRRGRALPHLRGSWLLPESMARRLHAARQPAWGPSRYAQGPWAWTSPPAPSAMRCPTGSGWR